MEGKVVVITGGSKGLGRALAELFLSHGSTVIICARQKKELEQVAEEIGATPFVADVAKEEDMRTLATFTVSRFGRVDVWVNNAGVWLPHAPLVEMDLSRVRTVFDVNVFGVMYGSKVALTQMQKQGEGVLVNIGSTSALSGRPTSSGYAASKWAVRGFTDSIREEYRGTNIKVISVHPGGMVTHLFDEAKHEEMANFMTAESVAEKIVANLERSEPLEEQIIKRPV